MTLLSKFLSFFPILTLGLAALAMAHGIWEHSLGSLILGLFFLYGLPVLSYRLHSQIYPLNSGVSYLQGSNYSPWWGSHQFQLIYIAFPALETCLRLVPGLFSVWLRLWGAQVGKQVYWTPALEIADRGLLTIGDGVVFGHQVGLYSHVIKPRRHNLMLYLKPITIGEGSFIGAGSYIGPGATVAAGSFLTAGSEIYPNEAIGAPQEVNQGEQPWGG
ncbi:maltose o-acetyltransferase [Leptolyngbya sp. Heron Island J]|uniref:maltose O-acetyltransferase n=1 Tax=Leptolyngbya sp. Heron Island J TaxID=1385935 RepID=UPI0003B98B5B|nr:maltose O-acetyltransferase [Leptolyngbya sp. Heron Island J]ESA35278.1 maltose o-acetyltransferase [Leptolyngbya sp. Heron Island J]